MFELPLKDKLIVPHLQCKASFTLIPLSLSLSVLVFRRDASTQIPSLIPDVA